MELTTELLQRFVGGQLESQNQREQCIYRGEIETIHVEDGVLEVELAWNAKGEGFPSFPHRWVNVNRLDYKATLEVCRVFETDGRVVLEIPAVGEFAVLFPPDSTNLDPSKVEGLELPSNQ